MISEKALVTDGVTTIYSVGFEIISEDHCNVLLATVLQSTDTYDVINNAIVFNTAPAAGIDLMIRVGTTVNDLVAAPTDIGICATNITSINSVANNIANVNAVNANSADVITVATDIASVNTTATNIADVTAVAGNATNINAAVANATNINAVVADASDIGIVATNIANVNAVAGNETNIDAAVANATNINAAVANEANINSAVSNATNINAAVANETNINAAVTNEANINSVVANEADIDTVAANITNVNTVAGNTTNINAVNANEADIDTVATNIASVNTVSTNIGSVNAFGEQYRVSATEPTTSLDVGDLWFDTTAGTMKVYDGTDFVDVSSSVNGVDNSVEYTATAGQTSFAATYDAGYLNVFLNGVKLDSTDYTATDGANVVLDTGATVGDSVFVQSFGTFELADVGIGEFINTSNIAISDDDTAGSVITTAADNVLIGSEAGLDLTTGSYNVMNGYRAGFNVTSGAENVFIGKNAGMNVTGGDSCVHIGANITTDLHSNVLIGSRASGGLQSTSLGYYSGVGTTGHDNVFIGSFAGRDLYTTESSKLVIGTSYARRFNPLIEGDFVAQTLNINGALTVNGAAVADTSLSNLSATGEQRVCQAWVSFDGTGTVSINDSYNVSSITDNGTGNYNVNFTNAMPNAAYAVSGKADGGLFFCSQGDTTSYVHALIYNTGSANSDGSELSVTVFGD